MCHPYVLDHIVIRYYPWHCIEAVVRLKLLLQIYDEQEVCNAKYQVSREQIKLERVRLSHSSRERGSNDVNFLSVHDQMCAPQLHSKDEPRELSHSVILGNPECEEITNIQSSCREQQLTSRRECHLYPVRKPNLLAKQMTSLIVWSLKQPTKLRSTKQSIA